MRVSLGAGAAQGQNLTVTLQAPALLALPFLLELLWAVTENEEITIHVHINFANTIFFLLLESTKFSVFSGKIL